MMVPDGSPTEEQLATELRALRPEPDRDFAAQLDAWAAEGFPPAEDLGRSAGADSGSRAQVAGRARVGDGRRSGLRVRLGRTRERTLLAPTLAAASVVFALVIAVGVYQAVDDRGGDDSASQQLEPLSGDAEDAAPEQAAPRGDAGAAIEPAPTTVPPFPGDEKLLPGRERIQERSAQMTLSAEPDEVAEVADGVVEVVERYDGIVVSSNVNTSSERGRAAFDLGIPTQNLAAALADMSDLASVRERNEGTLDITAPFVSAQERFTDARATVDALIGQLAEAGSQEEVAEIRGQLRAARGELAAARSELAGLKRRAGFSRVSVTVVGDGDADGWSLGDAADDAVNVLEDLSGAALIGLAVIVPFALIALLAALAYRLFVRRARERALD